MSDLGIEIAFLFSIINVKQVTTVGTEIQFVSLLLEFPEAKNEFV